MFNFGKDKFLQNLIFFILIS